MGTTARATLALALALLGWGRADPVQEGDRSAPGPPPEPPSVVDRAAAVGEYFALVDPREPRGEPLGVLRHVRLGRGGADWQVEQELLLHGPEARHHTVELYRGDEASLVHREQARPGARTIRAHWPLSGATPPISGPERLREWEPGVVQWHGTRRTERRFPGARGWQGPLGLVERLRWGLETRGRLPRLEVLSGLPEPVRVTQERLPGPLGLRLVRLTDDQGAGRGAYLFLGTELLAVAWQGGGPLALRVTRERYEALAARHPLVRRERGPGPDEGAGVRDTDRLEKGGALPPSTVGVLSREG